MNNVVHNIIGAIKDFQLVNNRAKQNFDVEWELEWIEYIICLRRKSRGVSIRNQHYETFENVPPASIG